jgi:hypothetical protein
MNAKSVVRITHSGLSWSSGGNDRGVYAIEFSDSQTFAFEARSHADAKEIVWTNWFVEELDYFCSNKLCRLKTSSLLRAATDNEAAAFRELAEEFADETVGIFLVTYLGGANPAAAAIQTRSGTEGK